MAARGVTLDEVLHALEGANENAAGGFVVQGSIEWTVRAVGRAAGVEDLRQTVVAVRSGTPVLLGDVADVREDAAVRRGIAHRLRGEVVSAASSSSSARTRSRWRAASARPLHGIQAALPTGVTLRIVYDQSELVRSALGGVGRAVLLGAVLVVLVLFAAARRRARRAARHADDPALGRPGRACSCARPASASTP